MATRNYGGGRKSTSKWRNGHGEREGRGSDPQTWRDEPWLAALLRLVAKDAWVGSEERLLDELKAFAGDRVYQPSDFPRTLGELHNYIATARGAFDELDLDVLDYRDVTGDSLKYWREEVTYLPGASAVRFCAK